MKFSAAFMLLGDVRWIFTTGVLPTLKYIWRTPSLLFKPVEIKRLIMSFVWVEMGDGIDQNSKVVKTELITPNAYGVVLDLGSGYGHTVNYLDTEKVTRYIALEPNLAMHPEIRKRANAKGFTESDGSLLILSCGAEDDTAILAAIGQPNTIDTLISILTLCSVPRPQQTLTALVRTHLKSGGTFVFFEHVLSPREDVAFWQRFWTPMWKWCLDGCRLDRPTGLWVERMGEWRESEVSGVDDEPEEHLFWHQKGKCIKA